MKKRITRGDVARMAGVSESTVSRALNNSPRISEEVKERVRNTAAHLGYVPNHQAVLLARNKTFRIGLVVKTYKSFSPFSRSYFPRLLDGVLVNAEKHGYSVTVVMDKAGEVYKDLSLLVRAREVDGLIFSVTASDDSRFNDLKKQQIPFVLTNNLLEEHYCVNCNSSVGMGDAFSHAAGLGHVNIGYISGDSDYYDGVERLKIFKEISAEYGIKYKIVNGNFSKTGGYKAAGTLLGSAEPPSLIMCASDRSAMGVIEYCKQNRIKIPEDLSVIGFDNLGPARDMVPGLTTVHNPVTRIGSVAMDVLAAILAGKHPEQHHFVDSGFIIRESTGVNRFSEI